MSSSRRKGSIPSSDRPKDLFSQGYPKVVRSSSSKPPEKSSHRRYSTTDRAQPTASSSRDPRKERQDGSSRARSRPPAAMDNPIHSHRAGTSQRPERSKSVQPGSRRHSSSSQSFWHEEDERSEYYDVPEPRLANTFSYVPGVSGRDSTMNQHAYYNGYVQPPVPDRYYSGAEPQQYQRPPVSGDIHVDYGPGARRKSFGAGGEQRIPYPEYRQKHYYKQVPLPPDLDPRRPSTSSTRHPSQAQDYESGPMPDEFRDTVMEGYGSQGFSRKPTYDSGPMPDEFRDTVREGYTSQGFSRKPTYNYHDEARPEKKQQAFEPGGARAWVPASPQKGAFVVPPPAPTPPPYNDRNRDSNPDSDVPLQFQRSEDHRRDFSPPGRRNGLRNKYASEDLARDSRDYYTKSYRSDPRPSRAPSTKDKTRKHSAPERRESASSRQTQNTYYSTEIPLRGAAARAASEHAEYYPRRQDRGYDTPSSEGDYVYPREARRHDSTQRPPRGSGSRHEHKHDVFSAEPARGRRSSTWDPNTNRNTTFQAASSSSARPGRKDRRHDPDVFMYAPPTRAATATDGNFLKRARSKSQLRVGPPLPLAAAIPAECKQVWPEKKCSEGFLQWLCVCALEQDATGHWFDFVAGRFAFALSLTLPVVHDVVVQLEADMEDDPGMRPPSKDKLLTDGKALIDSWEFELEEAKDPIHAATAIFAYREAEERDARLQYEVIEQLFVHGENDRINAGWMNYIKSVRVWLKAAADERLQRPLSDMVEDAMEKLRRFYPDKEENEWMWMNKKLDKTV